MDLVVQGVKFEYVLRHNSKCKGEVMKRWQNPPMKNWQNLVAEQALNSQESALIHPPQYPSARVAVPKHTDSAVSRHQVTHNYSHCHYAAIVQPDNSWVIPLCEGQISQKGDYFNASKPCVQSKASVSKLPALDKRIRCLTGDIPLLTTSTKLHEHWNKWPPFLSSGNEIN